LRRHCGPRDFPRVLGSIITIIIINNMKLSYEAYTTKKPTRQTRKKKKKKKSTPLTELSN
jgi:hypothetical protein